MRVCVVFHYDDISGGEPSTTAIIKMPEGMALDDVFLTWLRKKKNNPNLTMKEVENADWNLYHWIEDIVTEL
jgi:hypothetical protein